ncbi:MAG: hypothetical protein LUE10_02880 [Alistipes sp.]|nr:hypothetical protein [Alistipes sp.]
MKRLLSYMGSRLKFLGGVNQSAKKDTVFIATPHKLITVEDVRCIRDANGNGHLEFSIRNLGNEIRCFGLKLINNFDKDGNEYDYILSFGRISTSDRSMLHYTLPHDIPIKVTVTFEGFKSGLDHLAQVKFSGICLHNRRYNKNYNPSGTLLMRNIPVADPAPVTSGESEEENN